jgi:uridine kinase
MASLGINQMSAIIELLKQSGKKVVYVSGASASGKSYFAKQFAKSLIDKGFNVSTISSDDYYGDLTNINYLLYGTFDHPHLVDYPLLQKNIAEYVEQGETNIPKYSFVERRRTGYEPLNGNSDFLIVEWLYTISELSEEHNPYKIFVDSSMEELIFRRIIRDQERVKEPVDMIVTMLGKVFPMWKLYGEPQRRRADLIVENDFEVLGKVGESHEYVFLPDAKRSDFGELVKREHKVDYMYNDSQADNGSIIVSEIYRQKQGFLDSVEITRRKADAYQQNVFDSVSVRMSGAGLLTQLHTLLQLSGMQYLGREEKIISVYEKDKVVRTIKEVYGKMYEQISGTR